MPITHSAAAVMPSWRLPLWGALLALLVAPGIAMMITPQVRWGVEDFGTAALLLGGLGLGIEIAMRGLSRPASRALACAGMLGLVLLLWAQAAVGIF